MNNKWERWATLSGVLAVPFWVVGVALITPSREDQAAAAGG